MLQFPNTHQPQHNDFPLKAISDEPCVMKAAEAMLGATEVRSGQQGRLRP